jgi:hypothetical protein
MVLVLQVLFKSTSVPREGAFGKANLPRPGVVGQANGAVLFYTKPDPQEDLKIILDSIVTCPADTG